MSPSSRPGAPLCALLSTLAVALAAPVAVHAAPATVLYLDRVETVERTLPDPTDLWIPGAELERVNGFVLKPEGACLEDLCVPVSVEGPDPVLSRVGDETWFSLTAFARKLQQAFVADAGRGLWSFSPIPVAQTPYFSQAMAPDFELPDRQGRSVRLSDFRGRKVLLLTWASW